MRGLLVAAVITAVIVMVATVHERIEAGKPVSDTEPPIGASVLVAQKFTPDTRRYICWQLSVQDQATAKFYTPCVSKLAWQVISEGASFPWTKEWSENSFATPTTTATPN